MIHTIRTIRRSGPFGPIVRSDVVAVRTTKRRAAAAFFLGALTVLTATAAAGQIPGIPETSPQRSPPVRLFLDCSARFCDTDHIRQETPYVDHVRDRHDADVYLFVAGQAAGNAGGTAFTLAFQGQGRFAGMTDTIRVTTPPEPTFAVGRATLTNAIEMGLMRYVVRTDPPGEIRIGWAPSVAVAGVEPSEARDPWNAWVFSVGVDVSAYGEQQYEFYNLGGNLSASRTTEQSKIRLSANAGRFEQRFELEGGEELVDRRSNVSANGLFVRSLSDHWSAGATASFRQSTRANIEQEGRLALAIEANVFPYVEASHREFIFMYEVGVNTVDYEVITIFDQLNESLIRHALTSRLNLRQPWGYVGITAYAEQVAPAEWSEDERRIQATDPSWDLSVDAYASLKLVRGLTLDLNGSYAKVGSQRYLPRGQATDEEILLRRRELGTGYRYNVSVGVSYRFGSIYNNVVNPRFQ